MRRRLLALSAVLSVLLASLWSDPARAQPFYEGKTLRIVVGLAAGGGFDTYARTIARHMARHIPGTPTIIVENMTGAGSLVSANHLYKVAKPDGLTMTHFNGSLLLGQVLGQRGIEFDAPRFEYVGAAVKEDLVCGLSKASGVTTLEQWMAARTPVKLGGTGLGSTPDNAARILKAALGLPIQLVSGYKGTADIRLAAEGGELGGGCWSWESMRSTWRAALEAGNAVVVLQVVPKSFPDLPRVPLAITFARTEEARRLIEVGLHHASAYARPFALPPGTPRDRVQLLRTALQETLKDKAFQAEAEKAKLALDPVTGEELEKLVANLFTLEPALVGKLKEILYN